jgi:isopentenyldiphosphate isomerase
MKTTDPQQELLTEVDKKNKVIGSIKRGIAHNSPDKIYRTIYIIVKNDKNEILLQKRSSTKDLYPDCWDLSVGGHVNFGTSYLGTAIKELEEELNIKCKNNDLKFLGEVLVKLPKSNEFFHVFQYNLKDSDKIKIETTELSQIKWMTIDEVKQSMQTKSLKWYERPLQTIKALY